MMTKNAQQLSDLIIGGSLEELNKALEALRQMDGEQATKLILEVTCSPDRTVSESELAEFAAQVGSIAD